MTLDGAPVKVSEALPKRRRLRASGDVKRVYTEGRRYQGRLLTAFVRRNELPEHRLGVTASKKAVGGAVERNRAKRLMRELFRRNTVQMSSLRLNYDWVLNAKRSLLAAGLELRFNEFRNIIAEVARDERRGV